MGYEYKEIMDHGSAELKEIIFIITQGNPPGKQEEKYYDEKIQES